MILILARIIKLESQNITEFLSTQNIQMYNIDETTEQHKKRFKLCVHLAHEAQSQLACYTFAKSIVDQVLEYICYDSNFEVNVFAYFISQSGCLWEDVSLIISEDRHDFVRFDTFVNYLEGRSSSKTSIKRFSAIASTIGLILCQRYCGPCLKHPFSMI